MSDPAPHSVRPGLPPNLPPDPAPGGNQNSGVWVAVFLALALAAAGIYYLHNRPSAPTAPAAPSASGAPAAGSASGNGGAGAGSGRRGGAGMGPTMVSTATATAGNIGIYVNALGVVTPISTVGVNSRVAGQIVKIYYQEGQMVKAGDPLLDIDPKPNQAALLQAQGQLARDQAMLKDARLDLARYEQAFASNAIPRQQLDTQTALVEQDEGTVQLDQGLLDNAKVQLAYCHLTAPISGRVGLRLVDEGNIVQAGSSNLVVVTQLQPISVIFYVAEDDLPAIQKQMRLGKQLVVDAYDRAQVKKLATGTLATIDNQIDPATGTVKFRAVFTNEEEVLFPNQFVNARLLVNTLTDATLLPNTAIQRNADAAFVYLLDPDDTNELKTITLHPITINTTDGTVSALDGLDPGDVVVADNFNKLTDGAKVMVRKAGAGTGRGGGGRRSGGAGSP
jgi:multidrug efflux system membrane fusion protein